MGKIPFSHKIDESFNDCFEKMCNQLGPPKYRILEAAIEVFDALPRDIQYRLRGLEPAEREPCLKLIAEISLLDELQSPISECIETIRDFATRYKIPDKEQVLLIASFRKALGPEKGSRATDSGRDIADSHNAAAELDAAKIRSADRHGSVKRA